MLDGDSGDEVSRQLTRVAYQSRRQTPWKSQSTVTEKDVGMPELKPGQSSEVAGSAGRTYVIRNSDGVYSCSCMAWLRQSASPPLRTCKHLKRFRGEQAELDRTAAPIATSLDSPFPRVVADPDEVRNAIGELEMFDRLWLDTEIADWRTGEGRLSLIQALPDGVPSHSNEAVFLDVLDQPKLVNHFIERVMRNPAIEKVFHNAAFDLRYLGDDSAVNVFCTLQAARALPRSRVVLPMSLSLKSLTEHFGLAISVSKAEQLSDWSRRPLSDDQLRYAALDVIYLRGVHLKLNELRGSLEDPATSDISGIEKQLLSIEPEFQRLRSEHEYLRELLKQAMELQQVDSTAHFDLSRSEWQPMEVQLAALAGLIVQHGVDTGVTVRLTRSTVAGLGNIGAYLESVAQPVERVILSRRRGSGVEPEQTELRVD